MQYSFGFDPSINDSAWAIVDTEGKVECGLIRNAYKSKTTKLDSWDKLRPMLQAVDEAITELMRAEDRDYIAWICEGQYASGRGNQEHNIRLGWVSAIAYTHGLLNTSAEMPKIAVPSQWTRNVPKEVRHPELLSKVEDEDNWTWHGPKAPASLMHNVYDAVGLAVWGMENSGVDN